MKIQIKKSNIEGFVDVYVNGRVVGTTITDGTLKPIEAYNQLKSSWLTTIEEERISQRLDF